MERSMSKHNHLVWDDFLLCLGMELAFGRGDPIDEQKVAEKMMQFSEEWRHPK